MLVPSFATCRRRLERYCPVPVSVVFRKGLHAKTGDVEQAYRRNGQVVLLIDPDEPLLEQRDCLIHGWAHAMAWPANEAEFHSSDWGVAYSRCYRVAIEGWRPKTV